MISNTTSQIRRIDPKPVYDFATSKPNRKITSSPQGAHVVSETSARSSRVTIGQGHEKFVCLNGVENLITDNADGSTYANLRAIANTYRDCGALTFGKRGKKCLLMMKRAACVAPALF